ncbi:MAG: adenosylcobinamide-phosphate synthase CbiB [Fusicatenibacter sp.]|nr:adenosylcobinamide-phosphate synthase CbiB [Lachnospiraceae bacterium]MDY2938263.1 adenosylcobinamide-phosphate synthase CbiB [Fusicatenibacter sp.]
MKSALTALIIGYLLDLLLGDPVFIYHPIRLIGNLIAFLEKKLRKIIPASPKGELFGGILLVILVCITCTGIPWLLILSAGKLYPGLAFALEVLWSWQILATKSLKTESMKVYQKLKENNLEGARYAVSMIVGRDTKELSTEGVTKAAVETVAENTSDGIIAPLLFLAIGGPAAGFFYKAVNTMDSMVGYKNEKYLYFGRCAAKLDDVLNFIPARLSAWIMIVASAFLRMNWKNAKRIYLRDRRKHASPNSAQTEAVMAGALEVQLAGDATYFGKVVKKPTIGDAIRPVVPEDIRSANKLMYLTSFFGLLLFGGFKLLFCVLF